MWVYWRERRERDIEDTCNRVMIMLTVVSKPSSKVGNNYMKVARNSEKW